MASPRPLPDEPGWQLAAALSRLDRAQRAAEAGAALGIADSRLMWLFSDHTPRTLKQVSDDLGLEQSTVNRQANAALASGLLRRFREAGRPAQLVEATEQGLATFAEDLDRHLGRLETALSALPERCREDFPALLGAFVEAYAAAIGPAAGEPRED